ncbi:hypothetical protein ES705_42766 [subsurface metagenome]
MAVEEQLLFDSIEAQRDDSNWYVGQRLTIPNRIVSKLAFVLRKFGVLPATSPFRYANGAPTPFYAKKSFSTLPR